MLRYTVLLEWSPPEDDVPGAWVVTVPTLPGCVTQGPTFEIALERVKEAVAGFVDALHAGGDEVPIETVSPVLIPIEVEAPAGVAVPA
jgi:antitoxin HicB